ncbi:MAG: HNH endonuclease [Candidatus Paceibacterota bacterium]
MSRCIYCDKKENEATFNGREHVIPQLMGTFENNPTLRGWVCDNCNSKIFNVLETKFKEDTEEGIYYQMFNFQNSCQIRIRGNNVKTTFSPGLGDDFFNEMFPFLKHQDNNWRIFLLPQIKIKRYGDNGYLILLVDELKKLNKKKFLEIKKLLTGVQSKDVSIFTGGNSDTDDGPLQEAIDILKKLGIDYKEGKRKFAPIDKNGPKKQFEVSMDCTVGADAGRVISKIAFNYFSHCAIQENRADILFHPNFSVIKSYIIGESDLPVKQVIAELGSEPIIYDEKIDNMRFIGHTVIFSKENGNLVSKISFLGKRIYTVVLGLIPDEFKRNDFGCGHLFDPINKKIHQLTQDPNKWGSGLATGFGLYKRL